MSEIRYPVEAMHSTAKSMRDNAYSALSQHDTTWRFIRYCVSPLPGFMQSILNNVLDPYDYRLRQSYQLQIDFANWLDYAATSMNGINQDIAHVFRNTSQLF